MFVCERNSCRDAHYWLGAQVAIQQAATDPVTGAIDMDLIQTGVSASERIARGQLAQEIKKLLISTHFPPSCCIPQLFTHTQWSTPKVQDAVLHMRRPHPRGHLDLTEGLLKYISACFLTICASC